MLLLGLRERWGPRHRARLGEPRARVHPLDLESVGVLDGELLRIRSEFGAVTVRAIGDPALPRKMVRVDGFLNEDLVPEAVGINALVSPETSDLGGGNVLYSTRVELEAPKERA